MADKLVCFVLGGAVTAVVSAAVALYTILAKSQEARKTWPASFRAFIAATVGFELGAQLVFICVTDLCLASPSLLLCFYLLPVLLAASLALLLISIHIEGRHRT